MPFRKDVIHGKDGLPLSKPWTYDEKVKNKYQLYCKAHTDQCLHHLDLRMEFKEHELLCMDPIDQGCPNPGPG